MNPLAIQLKEIRISRNCTQEAVSSCLHITRSSYANYENGNRTPSLDILIALADFYQISLDTLIGRSYRKKTTLSTDELFLLSTFRSFSDTFRQAAIYSIKMLKNLYEAPNTTV